MSVRVLRGLRRWLALRTGIGWAWLQAAEQAEREELDRKVRDHHMQHSIAREGPLAVGEFFVLENRDFAWNTWALWIDEVEVGLREHGWSPSQRVPPCRNTARALELAREEVRRRRGDSAADAANFRVIWGGSL